MAYSYHQAAKRSEVTRAQIKALSSEAAEAGDLEMVKICEKALNGNSRALAQVRRALEDNLANRNAATGGPDPISLRAFLSEYEAGEKQGRDEAMQASMESPNGPSVYGIVSVAEEDLVGAAEEVKDLANRIVRLGSSARINPLRFGTKMSQSLSALFYNAGRLSGLKNSE
jgi:hypothetical protein